MALLRKCGLGRDVSLVVGFEVSKAHLTLRLSPPAAYGSGCKGRGEKDGIIFSSKNVLKVYDGRIGP